MLDTYGHLVTDEKIAAQGSMLERIMPENERHVITGADAMKSGYSEAMGRAEKPVNTGKKKW